MQKCLFVVTLFQLYPCGTAKRPTSGCMCSLIFTYTRQELAKVCQSYTSTEAREIKWHGIEQQSAVLALILVVCGRFVFFKDILAFIFVLLTAARQKCLGAWKM